jgi:hypothetical protein
MISTRAFFLRFFGRLVLGASIVLVLSGRAAAAPLGLVTGTPDITASNLVLAYDPAGGLCGGDWTLCYSSDASTWLFAAGLLDPAVSGAEYHLKAQVDPSGQLTGGVLSIDGYVSGSLTAFGFEFAGGVAVLEFLAAVNGGSLAHEVGSTVGVVGMVFGFTGFDAPFTIGSDNVNTDNFAANVPEPTTVALLGLALAGYVARRRLRR